MTIRNIIYFSIFSIFTFCVAQTSFAESPSLLISPAVILQGDPFLIQISEAPITSIKKSTFDGKKLDLFTYQNKPTVIVAIDLNKKPGTYKLIIQFHDGSSIEKDVNIGKRDKTEKPLGIPEKLGGNTKESQDKLVASLVAAKKSLANIKTNKKMLWTEKFIPPLSQIFVTDPYGNSRKTGEYSIPHKGTDYRAKIGTEVLAINRGVVRITSTYRDYGKTIFIDHGMGLMSYYLHLSKMKVKVGQVVEKGQVIALSGDTGYTLGAHLHLGIRIDGITIDPEKFFELFK